MDSLKNTWRFDTSYCDSVNCTWTIRRCNLLWNLCYGFSFSHFLLNIYFIWNKMRTIHIIKQEYNKYRLYMSGYYILETKIRKGIWGVYEFEARQYRLVLNTHKLGTPWDLAGDSCIYIALFVFTKIHWFGRKKTNWYYRNDTSACHAVFWMWLYWISYQAQQQWHVLLMTGLYLPRVLCNNFAYDFLYDFSGFVGGSYVFTLFMIIVLFLFELPRDWSGQIPTEAV